MPHFPAQVAPDSGGWDKGVIQGDRDQEPHSEPCNDDQNIAQKFVWVLRSFDQSTLNGLIHINVMHVFLGCPEHWNRHGHPFHNWIDSKTLHVVVWTPNIVLLK
jgi:hypothetical protein